MGTKGFETRGRALAEFKSEIEHCVSCPKLCRHMCPVAEVEHRETVTPWGLMTAVYLRENGYATLADEDATLVYYCTGCRACQEACKFDNDVPGALHALRGQFFRAGQVPERVKTLVQRFHACGGNLYRAGVLTELRDLLPERWLDSGASRVILVDPTTIVRYRSVISDIVKVLDVLDLHDIAFFVDEQISGCGYPLYDAGDLEGFVAYAKRVRRALARYQQIITVRPSDAFLLRDVYPTFGLDLSGEILPLIELVAAAAKDFPSSERGAGAMVLHQSCHLARPLNGEAAARILLDRIANRAPREPIRSGKETTCCGGGGGVPMILPDLAQRLAEKCLERLTPGQDEIIVTTCSGSRRQLEKVTNHPVMDWVSVVARALEEYEGHV